jgi:hypothetical protein
MNNHNSNDFDSGDNFDLKKEFFKYLFFWKYFLLSLVLCFSIAFVYLRYSSKVFETNAKVKILDKKDSALELLPLKIYFQILKLTLRMNLKY